MSIATKTWIEHHTAVRVLTTEPDGLSPASAAVRALDRIAIRNGALATTRATEASPWQSITVAARTGLHADAAAAAAISKDDGAIAWLQQHRLAARLVETDGTIHYIGRWPDPNGVAG
ncbi:MAG: hypothetical protein M3Z11_07325 [Candidatus Dormibacteraeota bacterium]|nr:hypothetical protein [Candidatus Dormibacteraeota bacterium]